MKVGVTIVLLAIIVYTMDHYLSERMKYIHKQILENVPSLHVSEPLSFGTS